VRQLIITMSVLVVFILVGVALSLYSAGRSCLDCSYGSAYISIDTLFTGCRLYNLLYLTGCSMVFTGIAGILGGIAYYVKNRYEKEERIGFGQEDYWGE